jgi:membrane-associated protease RseP (regulator of RpoE activity)
MTGHMADRYRTVFLIAAAVFVILGTFNLLDQGDNPYDGYVTDGNNTIIRVDAGGPTERAGLKVGDRIRSIDGIPVEDRRIFVQQGRPRIGQATTLVVERRRRGTLSMKFVYGADCSPALQGLRPRLRPPRPIGNLISDQRWVHRYWFLMRSMNPAFTHHTWLSPPL